MGGAERLLLDFEWFRCRDHYRIVNRPSARSKFIAEGDIGGGFIVPNSDNWEPHRPLEIPKAYSQFGRWNGSDKGLVDLVNAFGSLLMPKSAEERIEEVRYHVGHIRALVRSIDKHNWRLIAGGLKDASRTPAGAPRPGIGRLGMVLTIIGDRPIVRFQPPTLVDALQAQVLFDLNFGIEHRKCRNPECDRWFPITGAGAHRSDAEYHSEPCRRRHTYISGRKKGRGP
jgi:hypothetical protein